MSTTEQNIADALRSVAKDLEKQLDRGTRSAMMDLHDLVEILGRIADRLAK